MTTSSDLVSASVMMHYFDYRFNVLVPPIEALSYPDALEDLYNRRFNGVIILRGIHITPLTDNNGKYLNHCKVWYAVPADVKFSFEPSSVRGKRVRIIDSLHTTDVLSLIHWFLTDPRSWSFPYVTSWLGSYTPSNHKFYGPLHIGYLNTSLPSRFSVTKS